MLLEFALSFVLFLLVTLVGVMDLGRAIWAQDVLAHASHEAVRYAIVRGADSLAPATESDIRGYLRSRTTFLEPDSVNVVVQWGARQLTGQHGADSSNAQFSTPDSPVPARHRPFQYLANGHHQLGEGDVVDLGRRPHWMVSAKNNERLCSNAQAAPLD